MQFNDTCEHPVKQNDSENVHLFLISRHGFKHDALMAWNSSVQDASFETTSRPRRKKKLCNSWLRMIPGIWLPDQFLIIKISMSLMISQKPEN